MDMERLTREETIVVRGKEMAACNYENDDCNDQCRYGTCRWQKKANMLLKKYEDTGLTPEQIMELKDRDKSKPPEEIQDAFGDVRLICPNCRNSVINYFNQSRPPRFCMICGQRLNWEECNGKGNMQHEL